MPLAVARLPWRHPHVRCGATDRDPLGIGLYYVVAAAANRRRAWPPAWRRLLVRLIREGAQPGDGTGVPFRGGPVPGGDGQDVTGSGRASARLAARLLEWICV
jgi:hypothetical protein